MPELEPVQNRFQWKWVGITFVLYLLFYLLPLFLAAALLKDTAKTVILGGWGFGGIIIVAAVAAYRSKGVTIIEPAIAGALMVFLMFMFVYVSVSLSNPYFKFDLKREALSILEIGGIVFILSLVGSWFGERAQKLWKGKANEPV